jgi:hypothetical protein
MKKDGYYVYSLAVLRLQNNTRRPRLGLPYFLALFVVVTCPVDYRPLNIRTEASICHGATPRLPRFLGRWCTDRTVCFYLLWPFFVIIHSCFKYHL